MNTVEELKQAFIFKDVPEGVLKLVAGAAEEMSVSAGETILAPSGSPNALYVIRSGTLRVVPEGATTPLIFGTGETLGEVPLIDGGPIQGTVTALERADLLVLRAGKLADALAGHPEAGYQLYRAIARSLASRLRRAVGMLAFSKQRQDV
ncbi:MAG TPA: cyclic nucleotide-binding domain-containing protein [Myxococcales bacterium]|jgi:CRP-like cAMP-binding protein|nr:cyclic nucleotide-binding domain-containing protein [Myxococcales bacterium]